MSISINGVNHFAVSVANMEESIAWYERIFGFKAVNRDTIPATGAQVCHMQAPGFLFELFYLPDSAPLPEHRKSPNTDMFTQGNLHISFGVPDAHILIESLKEMGVNIAFIAEVNNTYGVFINDNTGNLIELFEEGVS